MTNKTVPSGPISSRFYSALSRRTIIADRVIKNGLYGKTPSYTLLNLMAAYQVTPKLTVRFNIDNVTNETYVIGSSWNGRRAYLGAPRTFLVSADMKF